MKLFHLLTPCKASLSKISWPYRELRSFYVSKHVTAMLVESQYNTLNNLEHHPVLIFQSSIFDKTTWQVYY